MHAPSGSPEITRLLSRSDWGEIDSDTFLREFAAAMAGDMGCSRFGVRMVTDTRLGRTLKTLVMYDRAQQRAVHVPDVIGPDVDDYLATVARCGGFAASDVMAEPRIPALLRDNLAQLDVNSMLDAAISVNGLIYGTLSCEQVGAPVQWSPHQVDMLRRVALRTAPTLVRVVNDELTSPGELWESAGPSYWVAPLRPPGV